MTAVVAPAVGAAVEDCRKKQKKIRFSVERPGKEMVSLGQPSTT